VRFRELAGVVIGSVSPAISDKWHRTISPAISNKWH